MNRNQSMFLVLFFFIGMMLSALPVQAAPTDGFTQLSWDSNSYYVQNRTDAPMSERFWIADGIYTTCVYAGEERVEMRWDDWASQTRENMFDADVMFEPGTTATCIAQVKSNTDGEPIYIQVTTNGDLRNNGDSTPIARNMAGKWFNLKMSFNPATGLARAWIDNQLVKTRQYNTAARDWYFKNGTYNNGIPSGGRSEAHFRNIKLWIYDGSPAVSPTNTPTPTTTPTATPSILPSPGGNLALNKPVTCSSQQTGNEAADLVDGDLATRWSASPYSQWVRIDFGAIFSINKTELAPYSNRAYQYKVEVSIDGTNFTQVVDKTGNTTGGSLLTDTFATVNARYVRLTVTGCYNYTGTWASINEFRIFGPGGVTPSPTGPALPTITPTPTITSTATATPTPTVSAVTNLALNKPVTCSSEQTGNEAYKLVDGDAVTNRWSASPFPQWVRIDLGATYSINKTELVPLSNRAYQYKVEISTDGVSFTQVVNRTGNTTGGSLLTDTFGTVSTRYVRLTVTGCYNYTGVWISINEFRVFGW